jgi:NitT/TauT family transport system substrate-binding protein
MRHFQWLQKGNRPRATDVIEAECDQNRAGLASRRSALKALAAGGAAAVAGGSSLGFGTRPSYAAGAVDKVNMAWADKYAACHAPIAFAKEHGLFSKYNLDVSLSFHGLDGGVMVDTIASGKVDMGAHLVIDWLKPLQQKNQPVKVIAGMHGGCQRLLVSKSSKIEKIEDLKGKTIAVGGIDNVAELAFLVTLAKGGLDPNADVKWVAFPYDKLGEVVHSGKVDALATLDPSAYIFQKKYDLLQLADTQTGVYHNVLCCGFAANNEFLTKRRDVARRMVSALIEASEYTAEHPNEVAALYVKKYKAGVSADDLTKLLGYYTYHLHPVGPALERHVASLVADMKMVKRLPADVNVAKFAHKITGNLLV